jgi:hypothetical protein
MKKLRIVVGGFVGLFPTGGATWDYIQYVLGFNMIGHDVTYVEDTMLYPIYNRTGKDWDDCSYGVEYLKKTMEEIGMKERWAYRDVASGKTFGMSDSQVVTVCQNADVFVNVSSSTFLRPEYLKIPVRVLVDTDPMFTQYDYYKKQQAGGSDAIAAKEYMKAHTHFFTFGLNIGKADCRIPKDEFNWYTTKKPICINFWEQPPSKVSRYGFTSIMNWTERAEFSYENEIWGQKNKEFRKFYDLPTLSGEKFEIIINRGTDPETNKAMHHLESLQWKVLSPHELISNKEDYKSFVQTSYAEFSVTKETYIKSNSGWFSGRSAVYLASGRPVLTQDTQWSKYLPIGTGLFAIHDLDSAKEAIDALGSDYIRHSKAAKEIAVEYFDSNKVLQDILNKI